VKHDSEISTEITATNCCYFMRLASPRQSITGAMARSKATASAVSQLFLLIPQLFRADAVT
jgi:hypothetical protein